MSQVGKDFYPRPGKYAILKMEETMEKATYAPAPWKWSTDNAFKLPRIVDGNGEGLELGNGDTTNARLIAAAPDLLEALKAVMQKLKNKQTIEECDVLYLTNLADAAIAKVEGGAA